VSHPGRGPLFFLFLGFLITSAFTGLSQPFATYNKQTDTIYQSTSSSYEPSEAEYDEVLITLNVARIGSIEIPAIVYKETAYLPVKQIFDYLKIWNTLSADLRSVDGFFINPGAPYSINKSWNLVTYAGKKYQLQPSDMILTETALYLRTDFFGQVFGLNCQFSFRSLTVNLTTTVELPALREMKMETMHKNMSLLKNEKKADTIIKRTFSLLRLGMLDWSVLITREMNNLQNTRISLGVGAILAGGEANLFLNHFNDRPFKMREQYYFWRNVNNESKVLKQVVLGKILANPASTIFSGITGFQVSNTPTTFRRSFGTYTLSDKTEPDWLVELYVNNVLVNFTRADASGFFSFEVPMVYGNSVVRLRFFGPWGEERTREQNLSIPFNFLPKNKLEYTLSGGIVDDKSNSRFTRTQFNYGLNKRITIGGGMEYLSSVSGGLMPFINTSVRLGSAMFLTGEHIHGVRSGAVLSYRMPSNLRIEATYQRFNKDQKAIQINYLDEKKLVLSKPFRGAKYSAFTRFTLNQFTLSDNPKKSKFTSVEWLMSVVAFGISSNLTNFAVINEKGVPLAFTNLAMTKRFPRGFNILPQVQYEYSRKQFSLLKMEVEKSLFNRGFLNISYEWDLKNDNYIAGIGFRYNFSFAQAAFSARRNKQGTTTMEMARGSVLYDSKTSFIGVTDQNTVGKGGLIVAPYLDLNCNNKRDANEPPAPGLKMKINGGRIQRNERNHTIRVTGLDAYTSYFVELDKNSFDNISWQIKKSTLRINIDPNHFTYLEVPVSVVGEVSGTVYFEGQNGKNGIGRIIVKIYNKEGVQVARTITEADGFFTYLGLPAGKYTVKVDEEQLRKLRMQSSSDQLKAELRRNKEGDAVGGLVFVLSSTDINLE
jgi:hypothetical protein